MDRPPSCRRTILFAVDDSDHSKYAFRWSLDNVVRPNGEDWVLLVTCKSGGDVAKGKLWAEETVGSPVDESVTSPRSPVSPSRADAEVNAAQYSRMENLLQTYKAELSKRFIPCKMMILRGDPKMALVGKADEQRADMMIMGSRPMGAIKK